MCAPVRPMGRIPVLVRMEWPTGAVWVPARANRWNATQVLVVWTPDEDNSKAERLVWLPAVDVRRSLPEKPG